jgi:hypothetical protein
MLGRAMVVAANPMAPHGLREHCDLQNMQTICIFRASVRYQFAKLD